MKNIIIYTTQKQSDIKNTIENLDSIDKASVRVELAEDLKEYELLNPYLLIVEDVPNLNDVLMTTKFKVPVLFVGEPINDVTIRALTYDYISTPINKDILVTRINSLFKVKELSIKWIS